MSLLLADLGPAAPPPEGRQIFDRPASRLSAPIVVLTIASTLLSSTLAPAAPPPPPGQQLTALPAARVAAPPALPGHSQLTLLLAQAPGLPPGRGLDMLLPLRGGPVWLITTSSEPVEPDGLPEIRPQAWTPPRGVDRYAVTRAWQQLNLVLGGAAPAADPFPGRLLELPRTRPLAPPPVGEAARTLVLAQPAGAQYLDLPRRSAAAPRSEVHRPYALLQPAPSAELPPGVASFRLPLKKQDPSPAFFNGRVLGEAAPVPVGRQLFELPKLRLLPPPPQGAPWQIHRLPPPPGRSTFDLPRGRSAQRIGESSGMPLVVRLATVPLGSDVWQVPARRAATLVGFVGDAWIARTAPAPRPVGSQYSELPRRRVVTPRTELAQASRLLYVVVLGLPPGEQLFQLPPRHRLTLPPTIMLGATALYIPPPIPGVFGPGEEWQFGPGHFALIQPGPARYTWQFGPGAVQLIQGSPYTVGAWAFDPGASEWEWP